MTVPLPTEFHDEIRKAQQTSPFVWLWQLTADVTVSAETTFYLCNQDAVLSWGGIDWRPYPFSMGEIALEGDGSMPTMTLTLDNSMRTLSRYLEVGQGFINSTAKVYLVNKRLLTAAAGTFWTMSWTVAGAVLAENQVSFQLELFNWNRIDLPADRFSPTQCRWEFGGRECGYVINGAAAYTACDLTVANCVARGLDMKARGLPQLQPRRFGGFVGIPTLR